MSIKRQPSRTLLDHGVARNVVAVAVARELVGFLWEAIRLVQASSAPA